MGAGGEDIQLSPAARKLVPLSIEAKNQERVAIWAAYEQASEHKSNGEPALFIKRNHQKPLVVIDAEWFLKILRNLYDK